MWRHKGGTNKSTVKCSWKDLVQWHNSCISMMSAWYQDANVVTLLLPQYFLGFCSTLSTFQHSHRIKATYLPTWISHLRYFQHENTYLTGVSSIWTEWDVLNDNVHHPGDLNWIPEMVVWNKCCSLLAYRYLRYLTHKFRTNCSVVGISWILVERQVHKGFRWRHPELMSLRLEAMSKTWKGNYAHLLNWDLPAVLSNLSFEPSGLYQWIHSPKLIAKLKGTLHSASWPAGLFIPKSVQKVWFGSSPLAVNHERGWRFWVK